MKAYKVKDIGDTQALFRLDPPLKGYDFDNESLHEFVVSSRCNEMCASIQGCYEVYLFPANADGEITNWGELPGSQKNCSELTQPLIDLGYEVI